MGKLFFIWVITLTGPSVSIAQEIVAHRGASHDAPENTLASFRLAWEQGADAIEGDFYLTGDRRIVCLHDRNTSRNSGTELDVEQSTLAELKQLDVGSWKAGQFAGERIPTLAEVLALVPEGKCILLDIKSGPEIVPVLKRELEKADLKAGQTKVIAFDAEVISETRRLIPDIEAFWLTGFRQDEASGEWRPEIREILATLTRIQAHGLDCRAVPQVVDKSFVAAIRQAGFQLHVWTINDAELAQQFAQLGADSITTDRPAYLRNALQSR